MPRTTKQDKIKELQEENERLRNDYKTAMDSLSKTTIKDRQIKTALTMTMKLIEDLDKE
jgi:hypothetical protein